MAGLPTTRTFTAAAIDLSVSDTDPVTPVPAHPAPMSARRGIACPLPIPPVGKVRVKASYPPPPRWKCPVNAHQSLQGALKKSGEPVEKVR